jgi:hypothetical protein
MYSDYANQTFHATQTQGANMTLQFFGTAIYVAGAKRTNHVCDLAHLLDVFSYDPCVPGSIRRYSGRQHDCRERLRSRTWLIPADIVQSDGTPE